MAGTKPERFDIRNPPHYGSGANCESLRPFTYSHAARLDSASRTEAVERLSTWSLYDGSAGNASCLFQQSQQSCSAANIAASADSNFSWQNRNDAVAVKLPGASARLRLEHQVTLGSAGDALANRGGIIPRDCRHPAQ